MDQPTKRTQEYLQKLKSLIGYTIIGLHYTPSEPNQESQFIAIHLKNRDQKEKLLWILSDDEGNCPGSFEIENK